MYLFWPTVIAYLRVATHPAVFAAPLAASVATANIDGLLRLPHIQTVGEEEHFWGAFSDVAAEDSADGERRPGRAPRRADA